MYAAIRQGTAKAGTAEELARRIKEGAIPIISDVPGFRAYYVIYAPDDTVTAISIFNDYAGAGSHVDVGWLQIEVKQQQTIISPPIVAQEVRESRERVREEGRYSLSFPVRWLIPRPDLLPDQIRSHSRFAMMPTLASIVAAASRQMSSR